MRELKFDQEGEAMQREESKSSKYEFFHSIQFPLWKEKKEKKERQIKGESVGMEQLKNI